MKISKFLLASAVALFTSATLSYAADLVVNITGSTAFRAAAHAAIVTSLNNPTAAYNGTDINQALRVIFKGTMTGISGNVTVRTSWSGSAAGIASIANGTNISVIDTAVTGGNITYNTNTNTFSGGTPNTDANTVNAVAKFAFSDVTQGATPTLSPLLDSIAVGVVPFEFIASDGAPASLTNITDQQFQALFSTGSLPLSFFTGVAADSTKTLLAAGRSASSGTRITTLAETGYGINNAVLQRGGTVVGDQVTAITATTNSGLSDGAAVATLLGAKTSTLFPNGVFFIAYIGNSDASVAASNGAKKLSYNGVPYSVDAVKTGAYTFWGYQQFLNVTNLTADEATFKTTLVDAIDPVVTTSGAGISLSDMNVVRNGDEGGLVVKK